MCGLIGGINVEIDGKILDDLHHRGPDGEGLIHRDLGSHRVTLGHKRLAIVDLSPAGAQPMTSSCGLRHIVFNGEIYNHTDLRSSIRDVNFHGHSDTETLLELLARSGVSSISRLNGIFGFALLDETAQKLYLARDPFGVKPLYYRIGGRQVSFASELRPLLSLRPAELDSNSLATLLRLRYTPSPATLFAGVRRVRPGHIVAIDLSTEVPLVEEYPYIDVVPRQSNLHSLEDAVEQYGQHFEQAIKRQLMADVEIGVLLSGGIDSALVAAFAQKHTLQPLKAFTIGFDEADDSADEIQDAAESARLLGLDHLTVRIGFGDFISALRECVSIVEEPLATTSIVPMHFLSKLAGNHVKVVMSGQGADEPLGGYGRYQGEFYRGRIPWQLARFGAGIAAVAGIRNERIRRGLESLAQPDEHEGFLSTYQVFTPEEIARLTGLKEGSAKDALQYWHRTLECAALPKSVERMMSLDLRMNLSDDLLLYTDKLTMRQSLECRVPMLDTDLIKTLEAMPYQYRVKRGRTKIVHKAFARQVLPESIINRPKKGFLSPTKRWFKDRDRLRDLLLDETSSFCRYFDSTAVERLINEHQLGFNRERHLFLLLCLRFWFDEFLS
jgi:asparagine synthase (glutamine-hydrolysing)